ncbi:putative membrane protein [Simiduia aestuariiviva]|uniref:Putative membrane protein n=1 Tax=Simiduia aestuariiviva TaxID=1510459 RepID=A0A839UJV4_9GAMM|nr:putative membrane protein [Simiduia aestuariiviva]
MSQTCPKCQSGIGDEPVSVAGSIGAYVTFELLIWIVAGILAAIFSICDFGNALILSVLVVVTSVVVGYYYCMQITCKGCGTRYTRNELRKYNKRL